MRKQEETSEMRRKLISKSGHDLRSLIFSGCGLARLLLKRAKEAPKAGDEAAHRQKEMETLERIIESGDHASQEIRDFTAFLKLEQIEKKAIPASIYPSALLDGLGEDVGSFLQEKHLTLSLDAHPELPPVFCHSDTMREVLRHILYTASNLATSGSSLTLEAREASDRKTVSFSVIHRGLTVPQEKQDKLFVSSLQIGNTSTGIALPLCLGYVRDDRGELHYQAVSDNEACFRLSLPVFDPETFSP